MRKTLFIILLLIAGSSTSVFAQYENKQTEAYAIIDVFENGRQKVIRVTIDDQPAQERVWTRERTEMRGDISPVIKELNELNKLGYELHSMSTAYDNIGTGTPRLTFMMVKKLE